MVRMKSKQGAEIVIMLHLLPATAWAQLLRAGEIGHNILKILFLMTTTVIGARTDAKPRPMLFVNT